jgi:hypothetical protein
MLTSSCRLPPQYADDDGLTAAEARQLFNLHTLFAYPESTTRGAQPGGDTAMQPHATGIPPAEQEVSRRCCSTRPARGASRLREACPSRGMREGTTSRRHS